MALSQFEIAVGGICSIPVTGGLIYMGFKTWGEQKLDASRLKPKKAKAPIKEEKKKSTGEGTVKSEKKSESLKSEQTPK